MKSFIKQCAVIVVFCFLGGAFMHLGSNVAKAIWPSPAIQLEVGNGE